MTSETLTVAEYNAELARTMPESELQSTVEAMLDQFDWLWFHHNDKANKILAKLRRWYAMSRGKGFFDIVAARDGVWLLIELKTEAGSLEKSQRKWRDEAQRLPWPTEYHLWRPRHLLDGTIERTLR